MEETPPPFLWEEFAEDGVQQVVYFTHQVCFMEALQELLGDEEAVLVSVMDADLRFGENSPYPSQLEEFTICL